MNRILGDHLKGKNGDVATDSLNNIDVVLFYFSASWCPPCRQFTPVLAELYNQVNASGKRFEVVYVSWDQSIQQFNDYYGHMPWLALPFENSAAKDALYQSFGINGVPSLVLVNKQGAPVNKEGRKDVTTMGPASVEHWRKLLA